MYMNKKTHYIYISFIFMVLIFAVITSVKSPLQPYDTELGIIEPVSIIQTGEYEREFIFDVRGLEYNRNDIAFFTKHQYVQIYGDNKLLYEYVEDGGIWGHTTGAFWTFLDIPHDTSEVKIVLTAAYDVVKNDVPNFYIGNELTAYQEVLRNAILPLLISVLITVFGISLIIYWVSINQRFGGEKSLLYLGIFATLIGLYLVNETDAVIMAVRHRIGCLAMTYALLMALSPTCIFFVKEFIGTVENLIWKLICVLSAVEFVVCIGLQMLDIMDLRETLIVSHLLIGVTAVYILVTLIVKLVRKEYSTSLTASLISVGVLCLSVFANLFSYYDDTSVSDTSIIGRLGFLIFISVLSLETLKNSLDLMEKGRKAAVYKELAITDMLTGLKNRNAYIRDIEAMEDYKDTMIVTFDLNNLKKCNDKLGHNEGDNYILSAANIIKEVFQSYGSCYRIGGDEFCVLIKNCMSCPITELVASLEIKMKERNFDNSVFPMHISYGYAVFDGQLDLNIEKTRDRADALMYEHKRKSKELRESN